MTNISQCGYCASEDGFHHNLVQPGSGKATRQWANVNLLYIFAQKAKMLLKVCLHEQ
jgi:hypothetical protein